MQTQLLVSIISASVALLAAGVTIWGQLRAKRLEASLRREDTEQERDREAKRVVSRFREPLVHAAFELQSRIFNILLQGLTEVYYALGTDRERKYVINNTAFLVAQYFGWVEIIRTEAQFLDLGKEKETRRLSEILDTITNTWSRDDFSAILRIFRGDQRGIGEQMIRQGRQGPECMGYAAFLERTGDNTACFLQELRRDVESLIVNPARAAPRMEALQHALIDLVDFLDPHCTRFTAKRRSKIEGSDKPKMGRADAPKTRAAEP